MRAHPYAMSPAVALRGALKTYIFAMWGWLVCGVGALAGGGWRNTRLSRASPIWIQMATRRVLSPTTKHFKIFSVRSVCVDGHVTLPTNPTKAHHAYPILSAHLRRALRPHRDTSQDFDFPAHCDCCDTYASRRRKIEFHQIHQIPSTHLPTIYIVRAPILVCNLSSG